MANEVITPEVVAPEQLNEAQKREIARQVALAVVPAVEQSRAEVRHLFESYKIEQDLARQGDQEFEFDIFDTIGGEDSPVLPFSGRACVGGRWIYNLIDFSKRYVHCNRDDLTAIESAQFAPSVGGFDTNPVNIEIFDKLYTHGDIHVDAM